MIQKLCGDIKWKLGVNTNNSVIPRPRGTCGAAKVSPHVLNLDEGTNL